MIAAVARWGVQPLGSKLAFVLVAFAACHVEAQPLIAQTIGRTIYISSSSGSDDSSGLTPQDPWRTLARAAGLQPGDSVLLKRGDTWRENLNPSSSGTASLPIAFGAYGSGSRPRILGSDSLTGLSLWTQESASLWYARSSSAPKAVFQNGVAARRVGSKANLRQQRDWWYNGGSGRLYFYSSTNPGAAQIEAATRVGVGWGWTNYIRLTGIEIAYAEHGVALYGGSFWTLDDLSIHDVAFDAIHGNGGARGTAVRNCSIQDWNWNGHLAMRGAGPAFQGYGIHLLGSNWAPSEDWVIEGNELEIVNMESGEDTTAIAIDQQGHASLISENRIKGKPSVWMSGVMIWRPKGSAPIELIGNTISNVGSMGINVSDFAPNNFTAAVTLDRNAISNTCGFDVLDEEALRIWTGTSAPVTVTNTLVAGTAAGANPHAGIHVRNSNATIRLSTIVGADRGILADGGSVAIRNTISSHNRVAALEVLSGAELSLGQNLFYGEVWGVSLPESTLRVDPLFVDHDSENYRLQADSPAVYAGDQDSDVSQDLDGNARPVGWGLDLGAYEARMAVAAEQPPSILSNGDFEGATLRDWEIHGSMSVKSGARRSGNYGAQMLRNGRIDQRFPTTSGRRYAVRAWFRLDREILPASWGGVRIQIVDSSWRALGNSGFLTSAGVQAGAWKGISFSFVASTSESRLVFENFSPGEFDASIDDILVVAE